MPWIFVRMLARSGEPIREIDLRQVHRLVLGRSDAAEAGRYSMPRRTILGSSLILPSPAVVPPLMAAFSVWLQSSPSLDRMLAALGESTA